VYWSIFSGKDETVYKIICTKVKFERDAEILRKKSVLQKVAAYPMLILKLSGSQKTNFKFQENNNGNAQIQ
jgi:hypothetical protein